MVLSSFVRRWINGKGFASPRRRQTTTRSARRRVGLRLEALEDRSVPSTVMNLFDSGPGSLRQAILDTPSGGTVNFQTGLSGTISLTTGELLIAKNLTIAGPGASIVTVSGNHASRVFDITVPVTVAIAGLTITDGMANGNGSGIYNSSGTVTVTASTLSGNSGASFGGGIFNDFGTVTVTASTLSGNSAFGVGVGGGVGGGIYNSSGTVTVTASTLSGNSARGIGGIFNGGTLTVTASTLSGNYGGGIANTSGMVTVTASTLTGNSSSAIGNSSGTVTVTASTLSYNQYSGILNESGTVTVTASTLSGNSGASLGGGISNDFGTVTVTASTLSGNSTGTDGGGIFNYGGSLTVSDSTLSGNSASYGAGIYGGTMTVTASTLTGNSASYGGGGIFTDGTLTIRNTIAAGNTAPDAPDVSGSLNSQGHNLIGDGTGGSGFIASDLVGAAAHPIDPKLGPLQNNGGPTQTMALLPGSPAIDAGDNAASPGPYDQRGPGFARIVNGTIDIGAFEVQAALTVRCSVSTPILWPPNHQLVNVGLSVQVSDPKATVTVQVFADDGAVPADAADLAPGTLRLRGDRQGGGSGRVYLVVVTATDALGDTATSACTVVVPHDHSTRALAAVEQQAADAAAYFLAFHTAPPGYRPLG
jgi:predicted outer membrane repeat protein